MKSRAGTETERIPHHPAFKSKRKALLPMAESSRADRPPAASACSSSSSSACRDSSDIIKMEHDQLISILQLLPIESVLTFSMTCRKFRSLGCSDSLWESICRRDWGSGPLDAMVGYSNSENGAISWKKMYQQVAQLSSLSCTRLSSREGIFPKPRGSHSLNFLSDCLVLYGGGCDGGRHLDDTWIAYVGSQGPTVKMVDWKQVNSGGPSGRFGHSCTVISDALILFGGIDDHGSRHSDSWTGQLSRVTPSAEIKMTWTLLDVGNCLPPPRGAHACCSFVGEKMIIHGGIGPGGHRLSDLWVLALAIGSNSGQWLKVETSGPCPAARSGHSLTWVGKSSMVLFGGRGEGYEALNDMWLLNLRDGRAEWVEVACNSSAVPRPRVGHSATLMIGGKVLIYGGEDSQRQRKNDVWLLDVKTMLDLAGRIQLMGSKRLARKMWRRIKAEGMEKNGRSFHSACVDQSRCRLFVFGGMVDGVLHPAEAYGLRFDGGLFMFQLVLQL